MFRCQVAKVWSGISSPGEVQSNVTCKCHVRNGARYLQHFSSLGPKPRLLYEILEFLTIGNKLVFIYYAGHRGHMDSSGDISGSQVAAFSHTCSSSQSQVI